MFPLPEYFFPIFTFNPRSFLKMTVRSLSLEVNVTCRPSLERHPSAAINPIAYAKLEFQTRRTFPIGFDVRCFTRAALEKTLALTDDPVDRVHGSYFIYRRPDLFKLAGWDAPAISVLRASAKR